MSGWRPDDAFDEDTWGEDDRDAPQERDLSDEVEEESPTLPCPSCRREVSELADRCPYCGEWITHSARAGRRPVWLLVGAVLALLALVAWALR